MIHDIVDMAGYSVLKIGFVRTNIQLDDDTIAAVKTSGLIGDRFIELFPGGSGIQLEPGDLIFDTQSAIDLESLISKFGFGDLEGSSQSIE